MFYSDMFKTIIPKQQYSTRIIIKADAKKRKEIVKHLANSFSQQMGVFLENEKSGIIYSSKFENFLNSILPGLKIKVKNVSANDIGRSYFGVVNNKFILAFKDLNQKCRDLNEFKDDAVHEMTHLFQSSLEGNPAQRLGKDIKKLHYPKKGLFKNKKFDKIETEITTKCGELYYSKIYKPERFKWTQSSDKENFRKAVLDGLENNGIKSNYEKIHHLRFFYKSVVSEMEAHGNKYSETYEFTQKAGILKEELMKALKTEFENNSKIYPKGKSGIL